MRKQARMIIMVDGPLFLAFEKAVADNGLTKAHVIRNLMESYLLEAESHPIGKYFSLIDKESIKNNGFGVARKSTHKARRIGKNAQRTL